MWSCPCAPSPNTSGNVRKVTHIGQSPTPRATEQEADITRHALEAACWLHLGCWSNNFAHSHVSLGAFNHEYCSPVRCRSAHIRLIEPIINDALRIVTTGCLRPTPANNLPILTGHGRRKDFFQVGASRGFSQKFFQEGPKVVKFVLYPSKLKKQPFLLIISKSGGGLCPPSDAHGLWGWEDCSLV